MGFRVYGLGFRRKGPGLRRTFSIGALILKVCILIGSWGILYHNY